MINKPYRALRLFLFAGLSLLSGAINAATIEVPIRFDTVFLTDLLRAAVFNNQQGISVWGDESGCNDLTLSNPEVTIEQNTSFIISDMSARTGLNVAGNCINFIRWTGKLKARQKVEVLDPDGLISFTTVDTELLDADGDPASVSNKIWEIATQSVSPQYDRLSINLVPAVTEIRGLLPLFLDPDDLQQSQQVVDSFAVSRISPQQDAIAAVLSFELDTAHHQPETKNQEMLSEQELAQFEEIWSRWDAFLGFIIKVAGRYTLTDEQQDILLGSLIDTRYLLVDALSRHRREDLDPVRHYFIQTWNQLRPVFRSLSLNVGGAESLRLLGFIAAVDALEALDQLGPVTGWDISVDGLRRLARMLIDDPNVDPLEIKPGPDPELRKMFDFGPSLELPPAQGVPANNDLLLNWMTWVVPPVHATGEVPLDSIYPTSENIDQYLERVRSLLKAVSAGTMDANPLDREFHKLFEDLVYTTAWQETCWRQYKRRKGKLEVVTSSAGALGMMQVMPKVWRGFYDEESLANSIEYNAAAGSEILHRYLVRYALRKKEHKQKGGLDNLVRASYAAYNGGPGQLSRYRDSGTPSSLKRIDQSFWVKFEQVRKGDELAVKKCYPF